MKAPSCSRGGRQLLSIALALGIGYCVWLTGGDGRFGHAWSHGPSFEATGGRTLTGARGEVEGAWLVSLQLGAEPSLVLAMGDEVEVFERGTGARRRLMHARSSGEVWSWANCGGTLLRMTAARDLEDPSYRIEAWRAPWTDPAWVSREGRWLDGSSGVPSGRSVSWSGVLVLVDERRGGVVALDGSDGRLLWARSQHSSLFSRRSLIWESPFEFGDTGDVVALLGTSYVQLAKGSDDPPATCVIEMVAARTGEVLSRRELDPRDSFGLRPYGQAGGEGLFCAWGRLIGATIREGTVAVTSWPTNVTLGSRPAFGQGAVFVLTNDSQARRISCQPGRGDPADWSASLDDVFVDLSEYDRVWPSYAVLVGSSALVIGSRPYSPGHVTGNEESPLVCLDPVTGVRRWSTKVPGASLGQMVACGDAVAVLTVALDPSRLQVTSIDVASGAVRWTEKVPVPQFRPGDSAGMVVPPITQGRMSTRQAAE